MVCFLFYRDITRFQFFFDALLIVVGLVGYVLLSLSLSLTTASLFLPPFLSLYSAIIGTQDALARLFSNKTTSIISNSYNTTMTVSNS